VVEKRGIFGQNTGWPRDKKGTPKKDCKPSEKERRGEKNNFWLWNEYAQL